MDYEIKEQRIVGRNISFSGCVTEMAMAVLTDLEAEKGGLPREQ